MTENSIHEEKMQFLLVSNRTFECIECDPFIDVTFTKVQTVCYTFLFVCTVAYLLCYLGNNVKATDNVRHGNKEIVITEFYVDDVDIRFINYVTAI